MQMRAEIGSVSTTSIEKHRICVFICVYLCPSVASIFFPYICLLRVPPCLSMSPWFVSEFLRNAATLAACAKDASHRKVALLDLRNSCIYPPESEPTGRERRCASTSRRGFRTRFGAVNDRRHALSESLFTPGLGNLWLWQNATHDTLGKCSDCS